MPTSDGERALLAHMLVFADGLGEALSNFRQALHVVAEWGEHLPPVMAGELRDQVDEWRTQVERLRSELALRSKTAAPGVM